MLSLALFLTGGYKQFSGKLSNKYIFAAVATANLLGLFFSDQKGAWLGGLTGAIVLTALMSWKLFFRSMLIITVLATLSWYCVPMVRHRIAPVVSGQDVGTTARFDMWRKAVELWHKSPVFGVGFMSFPPTAHPEAIVPGRSKALDHAHSNYLQFLSTTGIIGGAVYAWLCVAILLAGIKSYAKARQSNDELAAGFALGTLTAMISLMVAGLFEFNFGTAQVRLAQWLVLALLAYQPDTLSVDGKDIASNDSVPDALPRI